MTDLMTSSTAWYSLAVLIFLGLVWKKARQPLLGWLDGEIAKIRDELDKARILRAEAEQHLAEAEAYAEAARHEAEALLAEAKAEAEHLRLKAENDLRNLMARRERQAVEHIRHAERDALAEIREAVIEQAIARTHETLATRLTPEAADRIIEQAIQDLGKMATKAA